VFEPRDTPHAVSGVATTTSRRLASVGVRAPPSREAVPPAVRVGGRSRRSGAIALVLAGAVATGATIVVVAGSDVLSHPHASQADTARGISA